MATESSNGTVMYFNRHFALHKIVRICFKNLEVCRKLDSRKFDFFFSGVLTLNYITSFGLNTFLACASQG